MARPDTHRDAASLLIKHLLYPAWEIKNGSHRLRYLAELEKSQFWSRERLLEHQWARFRKIVTHAYATCSYYRESFRRSGIVPEDLRSPEDINLVPTVTKEDIQEHGARLISENYQQDKLIRDMTGGSTGSPMVFYYDNDRLDTRTAATIRHNRWAGWDIGDRSAILWGAPRDIQRSGRLKDSLRDWILDRRLTLDAALLDDAAMARFADKLSEYHPKVLLAYANTLGLFAKYVRDRGISGVSPETAVCSAEVLTDENRRLIEETLSCTVYNRYGCREFAVIASECDRHDGMHINAENLMVEVIADGQSRQEQDGEIVVTDLRNFAMPMIRYRIRDVGRIKSHSCACGRGLPLMQISGGRVTDFLTRTDGKKVSGIVVATYVITNLPGIRQIQFVQNEMRKIVINLVKGEAWSSRTADVLQERVREFLGPEIEIRTEFLADIPSEKSGKYRFSISTLPA